MIPRGSSLFLQYGRTAVQTWAVFREQWCCHKEGHGHVEGYELGRLGPMPSFQCQLARSVPRDVSTRLHDLAHHSQMADDSVCHRQPTTGLEADCTGTPAEQSVSAYSMVSEHQ